MTLILASGLGYCCTVHLPLPWQSTYLSERFLSAMDQSDCCTYLLQCFYWASTGVSSGECKSVALSKCVCFKYEFLESHGIQRHLISLQWPQW